MDKRLIIIGASAMGRETAHYAEECIGGPVPWTTVAGFLDSRTSILDGYKGYPPVLASVEDYQPLPHDLFVCSVGDIIARLHYVQLIEQRGGRFVSVIHPKSYIGKNVVIPSGCIVSPGATLTADISLGQHVMINVNASISHDCSLGDGTTLAPGCTIAGWCKIGKRVDFGTHAAVLPRRVIADDAIIGAGAIVVKDIVEAGTYIGCPARRLK